MNTGLFLAVLSVAASCGAATLRVDDLVAEALANNPEILAAQKRYEAARQRPAQASSLPDPMLSLGYTSSGSPRPLAGIGREPTSNAGFMLSQEFPWPGKRKLRGEIAGKEAEADSQDYRAVQLNVISRVKQAYHRLQRTYGIIGVLGQSRDLLRKMLEVAEARYSAGKAAQQDLFKAQTQLSILETRLVRMEAEKRTLEAEINSLLARPAGSPPGRPEEAEPGPLAATLDALTAAARENSPVLRRDEKMIQRSQLALDLARRGNYPDYTVSAGYFSMGRMPDMYQFRVDFKLPAWSFRKQRAEVAEQASNLSETRHELAAAGQELQYRIQSDYLAAKTSEQLMRMYADTVIPQAELAVESSLVSYETGAVDLLSVLSNLMTKFEYEENYHEERLAYQVALARLEELTGTRLID
ncbi:MAG TPA: TolC family protein [Bryobacteraceae bacterium]|nr:TolC family protein [Bryobacteraceae bacterium]